MTLLQKNNNNSYWYYVVVIVREDCICLVGLNRSETTTILMNNAAKTLWFQILDSFASKRC